MIGTLPTQDRAPFAKAFSVSFEQSLPEALNFFADSLAEAERDGNRIVWAALYTDATWLDYCRTRLASLGAWSAWPMMAVVSPEPGFGGIQWMTAPNPSYLDVGDVNVGACWNEGGVARLSVCGLTPPPALRPAEATRHLIDQSAKILANCGLTFADVFRTWYFNDDILSWYDAFNRVRRDRYDEHGIDLTQPPASTGIGIANGQGAPLTLSFFASSERTESGQVRSPEQNAASDYGSYFSRAWRFGAPRSGHVFVSGTAAIDAAGLTQFTGDFRAQTRRTYEVLEAMLRDNGRTWRDVSRATAYFRHVEDIETFRQMEAAGELPETARIIVPSTVCRDDLLFEMEIDFN